MNHDASAITWSNPFSAHRVRPGALSYRFPDGSTLAQLVSRLRQADWRGQIVGPHGTGKTTLLRTLDDVWASLGRTPIFVTLQDRQRLLPRLRWQTFDHLTQLIVDGYEQLMWLERWRLRWNCRRRHCGLLVTTHREITGLPVIHRTQASVDLVRAIARDIVAGQTENAASIPSNGSLADIVGDASLVERRFAAANGNVRETWMLLYDDAERHFVHEMERESGSTDASDNVQGRQKQAER